MVEFVAAWLPLIIFFVIFAFLMSRSTRTYKKHVEEVNTINQAIVDTNKEMIAELREIKQILKDQT